MRAAAGWLAASALLLASPNRAPAQGLELAFRGAEVFMGTVFPTTSERGAAFGGTLWMGRAFHPRAQWGLGLQYGSADRTDGLVSVRDIVFSIDLAVPLAPRARVHPYVGVTGGLHSADALVRGTMMDPAADALADELDGYRLGGGGFAGLIAFLTETGSVGLFLDYRFVAARDLTHQMARVGIRFSVRGR